MRRDAGFAVLIVFTVIFCFPAAARACGGDMARPVINVSKTETPVAFDLTRSVKDLGRASIDTDSPFPSHYHTDVGGMMSGEMGLEHLLKFGTQRLDGQSCVTIKEVHVELSISPTIFIANDFQDQACWFKEIFAHEAKHVDVDRALMNKYETQLTDALNLIFMEPADFSTGWTDAARSETALYDMQQGVEHALQVMFNKMINERAVLQQEVDSLDEYARISRACQSPSS